MPRNVLNGEEVVDAINNVMARRELFEEERKWCLANFRKWVLNSWSNFMIASLDREKFRIGYYCVLPDGQRMELHSIAVPENKPWVVPALERGDEVIHLNLDGRMSLTGILTEILDYFHQLPDISHLSRVSVEQAMAAAHSWHEGLKKAKAMEVLLEGCDVLAEYPDGFQIVSLKTEEQLIYEGQAMGHCVGGYYWGVANGSLEIFSLRDGKGEPHATMEINGTDIQQIKGKGNGRVVEKYRPYLIDFIRQYGYQINYDEGNIGLFRFGDDFYSDFNEAIRNFSWEPYRKFFSIPPEKWGYHFREMMRLISSRESSLSKEIKEAFLQKLVESSNFEFVEKEAIQVNNDIFRVVTLEFNHVFKYLLDKGFFFDESNYGRYYMEKKIRNDHAGKSFKKAIDTLVNQVMFDMDEHIVVKIDEYVEDTTYGKTTLKKKKGVFQYCSLDIPTIQKMRKQRQRALLNRARQESPSNKWKVNSAILGNMIDGKDKDLYL